VVIGGAVAGFVALAVVALLVIRPFGSGGDATVFDTAGANAGATTGTGTGAPAGAQTPSGTQTPAADTPAVRPDSQPRTSTATPPDPASVPLDAATAERQLEALDAALHPDRVTPESARQTLRTIDRLLPRLPRAADTTRALLLQSEAYIHTGQIPRTCELLRAIESRTLTNG
jgi:hypothetical protein